MHPMRKEHLDCTNIHYFCVYLKFILGGKLEDLFSHQIKRKKSEEFSSRMG
jgi:hypothetical protein